MEKKTVYTIADAHLDTVWNWDFEKTVGEYLLNTLEYNFKLFDKYPQYNFNFEGAYRYELMEEYYPNHFEKLKDYIKNNRWNICGSAYENGDVNVPSPEALFRNILLGNNYFYKKFGKKSVDIFLPDCFGFGYALPSVMRHANLLGFTTQKLTWGSAYGIPFDIGKWYGVDGSYVYACTNPGQYDKSLKAVREDSFVAKKLEESSKNGLNMTCVFHGTGDRGGAPAESSVKTVVNEVKKNGTSSTQVLSAPADKIYHDLEALPAEARQKLPVWNNELVMTNHGAGSYTSRSIGKRWNRRNEEIADMAERACVVAATISGHRYPQDTLTRAWKRVIAHQFHDDLTGTSVQRAYLRSWNDYYMSLVQFTNEYTAAARYISGCLDTSFCKGIPLVVNNHLEYERTGIVEVKIPEHLRYADMAVFDQDGKEYPTQIKSIKSNGTRLLMNVTVPAMGFKVFDIRNAKPSIKSTLLIDSQAMENEKYVVKINSNGDISSIFDKELKKEILAKPIVTGIFDYKGSSSWPAWELNYEELNRHPQRTALLKSIKIFEKGPCRVSFKIIKEYEKSTFTYIIALSRGGKYVEVYNETEWQSKEKACKEIFSFTASNHNATYDLGLGAIKRGNMTEKLFEVPAQKWADITNSDKSFGVSVISECKYGWDKFDNNTLRLTILHTPKKDYRSDSVQSMMDLGLNRYSYAIYSHIGEVSHSTQCAAREFVTPMAAFICSSHQGELGTEVSFGELHGNAIVRAVKKAEDSDEIVIRIGEGEKKYQKNITLTCTMPIESAREIYASEEHIANVPLIDGNLVFDLEPYETKTFALKIKKGEFKKPDQVNVELSGNITAFSKNSKPLGALPKIEKTIPWELAPDTAYVDGTAFKIDRDKKALLCGGQTLILPKGTKKLHLLTASLNGDKPVKIADKNVVINDIKEYPGCWDLYDLGITAHTKHGKLAYEFTHSHTKDGDAQCEQLFFWKITIPVSHRTSVTLPVDRDIVIISATADSNENVCRLATTLYDNIQDREFKYKPSLKEKTKHFLNKALNNN